MRFLLLLAFLLLILVFRIPKLNKNCFHDPYSFDFFAADERLCTHKNQFFIRSDN